MSTIGRYEVIYPIAQGGMASVHVGRLPGMAGFEKLVAIKVIHQHLSGEQEFIEMFLDEARLAAQIHHPNVVEIHEVGEDAGRYFMVGELIEGQNLRVVQRRAGSKAVEISPAMWAQITAQIGQGLHTAHELTDKDGRSLNLVHRDVSLNNILVSYSGFAKLIDFGVAWAEGRLAHTKTGTMKGKIGFMSPEQILGEQLDRRSDIFALGVVIYTLITGVHPFPGGSDAERIHKILEGNPVPPREVDPRVSPELERIVLTALAKSREQRQPNASVLAEELQAYATSTGEDLSTDSLSRMMRELFDGEITDHHEQLKAYRASRSLRQGDTSPSSPVPRSAAPTGPVTAQSDADMTSAARPSAKKHRQEPVTKKKRFAAAAAIVGIAVAFVIAVVLTVTAQYPTDHDTEAPVEQREIDLEPSPSKQPQQKSGEHTATEPGAAATVLVTLDVFPPGASVELDGDRLPEGTERFELPADGSQHIVEISAAGYQTNRQTVIADSNQRLDLRLEPKPHKRKPQKTKTGRMDEDNDLLHSPYR